jgi:hypothetical protein
MSTDKPEPNSTSSLPPAPPTFVRPPAAVAGRIPDDDWQSADPMPVGPTVRRALQGQIRALCPRSPAPWSDEIAQNIERGILIYLRYLPPVMGWGFGPMLVALDLSPLWRLRSFRPLHSWDREAAAKHMQMLSESRFKPIRLMVMAARAAVLSYYYDQDEVHDALDYAPMPFLQQRSDIRRKLLDGEEAAPEDQIGPYAEVM